MHRRRHIPKMDQILFGSDGIHTRNAGGTDSDRRLCGWYARNAVLQLRWNYSAADSVLTWLFNHTGFLGLKIPEDILTFREADESDRKKFSVEVKQKILRAARRSLAAYARRPPIRIDAVGRNIRLLARELGLTRLEEDLLCIRLRCVQIPGLDRLADAILKELSGISAATSYLLGISQTEAHRLLLPQETLTQSGFINLDLEQNFYTNCLTMPRKLQRVLTRPLRSISEIQEGIIGKTCRPSLTWRDFDHLSIERDFAAKVLSGALKEGEAGVNILLYGPPGTGKTELCKTLAKKIGASIFSVAESDNDGDEPEREERLSQLRLVQRLLKKNRKSLVLFDEMEDIQRSGRPFARRGSKIFMNRLLEGNATPTVWTANNLGGFDRALLRRFTAVMEIPLPGPTVRQRIWAKLVREAGIQVESAELKRLAAEVKAAPGVVANAVDAARLAGGGADHLRHAVHGMAKAMDGGKPVRPLQYESETFLPDLVTCDIDLGALTKRLCAPGAGRGFSLCLYGPPGTGKSMYARHLAKRLQMEVEQKRGSDLMSMWVGGTEKNIARAFEEARSAGSFLIFDEADSLLGDRRSARASWEISQVNEMLSWMESHDLPFVCTTNLSEKLDQASLRRFTFKLHFEPLAGKRLVTAFGHFFGADAPPELLGIENLTPGDFAVVKRRAAFTGDLDDVESLVKLLRSESRMKEPGSRPIGFGSAL